MTCYGKALRFYHQGSRKKGSTKTYLEDNFGSRDRTAWEHVRRIQAVGRESWTLKMLFGGQEFELEMTET